MSIYIRDDKQYTQQQIESVIWEIGNNCSYHRDFITAELIAQSFLGFNGVVLSSSFNGMACINLDSHRIIINPNNIVNALAQALPAILYNIELFDFLVKHYSDGSKVFSSKKYVEYFSNYLVLHEIGHYLYTLSFSKSKPLFKEACLTYGIPLEFATFVSNVIEDSFIQRRLQLDYPSQLYRDVFLLGTTIIQGPIAVHNFLSELNSGKPMTLYNKLFYLILRAYNLDDADVQSMFDMNPVIGWTQEALDLFDKATTIVDSQARFEFTINTLLPVLFDIVHEVVDSSNSGGSGEGSLMNQDKLYEAKDPSPSDSPDSNGEEGSENKAENSSENKSSDSDEQVNEEEEKVQNLQENEANSLNESEEDKSDSSESKDKQQDTSESGEDNKKESSTDDASKSAGSGDGNASGFSEEEFLKELVDACKELTKMLEEEDKVREEAEIREVSNEELSCDISGVERSTPISLAQMSSDPDLSTRFNKDGLQLYNISSALFKRIFTFDTDDLSYLDNGELDEDIMVDFYTEKSLNIFKQHIDLVESKNIYIMFLIDDSGSMYKERARALRIVIPPLIQAFEDSGIKCSLYTFSSNYRLVKSFDDPSLYVGGKSNIQKLFNDVSDGGGTNICPVLRSLCAQQYDTDNNIYVAFTFTDGYFDNEEECRKLYKYLLEKCGINLFGVVIEDSYGCERLSELMFGYNSSPLVINYTNEELISKLPEDIYNTIINTFIKLK